jgi:hypothetical protein
MAEHANAFFTLTLLALVGVAVPLKHFYGFPQAVSVMGPIRDWPSWSLRVADAGRRGGRFVPRGDRVGVLAARLPFGGFVDERRFAAPG